MRKHTLPATVAAIAVSVAFCGVAFAHFGGNGGDGFGFPGSTSTFKSSLHNNVSGSSSTTHTLHSTSQDIGTKFSGGSESYGGVAGHAVGHRTFAISGTLTQAQGNAGANAGGASGKNTSFQISGGYAAPGSAFNSSGDSFAKDKASFKSHTANVNSRTTRQMKGSFNSSFKETGPSNTITGQISGVDHHGFSRGFRHGS